MIGIGKRSVPDRTQSTKPNERSRMPKTNHKYLIVDPTKFREATLSDADHLSLQKAKKASREVEGDSMVVIVPKGAVSATIEVVTHEVVESDFE